MRPIFVGGYPSFVGGADSELLHAIDLWRMHNVDVHLVPMGGCNERMKEYCDSIGCVTHEYQPNIFKGQLVASWCNGNFLEALPDIMEQGKPEAVIWFNSMTWAFPKELEAHAKGWIDYFGFVSRYQRQLLGPQLVAVRPIKAFDGYKPYYNVGNAAQAIRHEYRRPTDYFGVGRISRDDGAKFSDDVWRIYDRVLTPHDLPKKTFILGFGNNARMKVGDPLPHLDYMTWDAGAISANDLFGRLHAMIHKTGGSRESYCRVLIEAYHAGVPAIVEDDYAFSELVIDGVTGYRCKSSDDMSYRASELAHDEPKRKKMIEDAYSYLVNEISAPDVCWRAWKTILN